MQGKHKIGYFILVAIGLCFCLLGIFAALIQAERTLREVDSISRLPQLDWYALENTQPAKTVIITGILAENNLAADVGGLIIYIEEIWTVHYNDAEGSEGWEGSWVKLRINVPDSSFNIDGGTVMITKGEDVVVEQTLHAFKTAVPRYGREVDGVKEGSIRHRGFKAGDELTVVGTKEENAIAAERIFGGNRVALEQYLAYQVSGLRIVGVVFILVGLVIMVIAVAFMFRSRQVEAELPARELAEGDPVHRSES